jgi:hypothetical protein
MAFLTKDQILNTQDLPYKDEELPAPYNGTVRVIGLSAEQAGKFANKSDVTVENGSVVASKIPDDLMVELLTMTLANEKFELLFTPEDMAALNKKSAKTVLHLAEIALDLSGLSDKAKKDTTKN